MQSGQHQASLQAYAPTAGTLGQGDAANRKINIGDAVHDGEGRVGAGTIQEGAAIPRRGGGGGGTQHLVGLGEPGVREGAGAQGVHLPLLHGARVLLLQRHDLCGH